MRVDDAVGLFWGQRIGWVLPLAHVASESEAVEGAEWSVRRSEFGRESRSKLGGFVLTLAFVSDYRDQRHLGERHVRPASRLSSLRGLRGGIEYRQSTERKRVNFQLYIQRTMIGKSQLAPARRYISLLQV
jgi:hypothetical protein